MKEVEFSLSALEGRRGSCSGFIRISGLLSLDSPSSIVSSLLTLSIHDIISLLIPECVSFSLLFSYDELLADETGAIRLFNFRDPLPFYFYPRDFIHFAD